MRASDDARMFDFPYHGEGIPDGFPPPAPQNASIALFRYPRSSVGKVVTNPLESVTTTCQIPSASSGTTSLVRPSGQFHS